MNDTLPTPPGGNSDASTPTVLPESPSERIKEPELPPEPMEPVEAHQRATGTSAWLHAATARRLRWGLGRELTRSAYVAAITETASHPCGV